MKTSEIPSFFQVALFRTERHQEREKLRIFVLTPRRQDAKEDKLFAPWREAAKQDHFRAPGDFPRGIAQLQNSRFGFPSRIRWLSETITASEGNSRQSFDFRDVCRTPDATGNASG
jgi:hypothetical protein